MKVWISRDSSGVHTDNLEIWSAKPTNSDGVFIGGNNQSLAMCWHIKRLLGFTPRKGSCKQYALTLEEIK